MAELIYEDVIPGGAHWSLEVPRGVSLSFVDESGGANVGMLMYNPRNPLERYNAPDTLKCQHTFKLTHGNCLYSDMGRIFCSIVEDTVGWHDTVGGVLSKEKLREKWPERTYQQARNEWTQSGLDSFLVELAKYGLGRKDLAANLNLFSKLAVDEAGDLSFVESNSKAGDRVTLRFEMDTLVIFHTCPHPMNPAPEYPRKPVRYQLWKADPMTDDDECLNSRIENRRGFQNNALYHAGCGDTYCC
jgi:uncharacterized protein